MRCKRADLQCAAIKPMSTNKPQGLPRVDDPPVLDGIVRVSRPAHYSAVEARCASSTMSRGVAIAAATRAAISAPLCGMTSKPVAAASCRKAGSFTVASKAERSRATPPPAAPSTPATS
jgi:hypothetical protein